MPLPLPLPATTTTPQSLTTSQENAQHINSACDTASDQSHNAAATNLNNGSNRGLPTPRAQSPVQTNIALQPIPPSNATSQATISPNGGTGTHQTSNTQSAIVRPPILNKSLVSWLVRRCVKMWNWMLGVVMLALGGATYAYTKLSDGQGYLMQSDYVRYCQAEEAAAKRPLGDDCKRALEEGLPAPFPQSTSQPHQKRDDTPNASNRLYDAQKRAHKALDDANSLLEEGLLAYSGLDVDSVQDNNHIAYQRLKAVSQLCRLHDIPDYSE